MSAITSVAVVALVSCVAIVAIVFGSQFRSRISTKGVDIHVQKNGDVAGGE